MMHLLIIKIKKGKNKINIINILIIIEAQV